MRILLVEDEPDLGAAIQRTLKHEKYIVDWVQDGTTAWNYLENQWTQYTLAIFDWLLPGLSGVELCQQLRAKNSPLPVLILTAKDCMEDKVTGLDAGADDYLVKPFGMAELLARLRALQRRSQQLQPQQLQVGNLVLDYGSSSVFVQQDKAIPWQVTNFPFNAGCRGSTPAVGAPPPHPHNFQVYELTQYKQTQISLTAKEFQLLEYFLKHPNQIVSREQILNQLWEIQAEPTSNVVAAQLRLLRRKLAEYGCGDLIETVYGLGYRFNLPHA
jgi:DNA-binding response OmpR family regulator